MKKIFYSVFLIFMGLLLVGCGKSDSSVVNKLGNKLDEIDSYYTEASMTIKHHNHERNYDLVVQYKKPELYRVELKNSATSNAQIIIKNNEGVYVLTPQLNKSFKFDSTWPMNGSHAYLMQSLVKDIVNAKKPKIETSGDDVKITVELENQVDNMVIKEEMVFDKNTQKPKSVTVYNQQGEKVVNVVFKNFEFNKEISDQNFVTKDAIEGERDKGVIAPADRKITYPTYFPLGSYLVEEDVLSTRAIMTFGGTFGFTVVQEFVDDSDSVSTKNVFGNVVVLKSGFGSINDSSISWIDNGIEYMVFSDVLSRQELIKIANSFIQSGDK